MTAQVAPELFYTTLTATFTGLIWMPYILNRIVEMGLWKALRNPEPDDMPSAAWAFRMMSAHRNAIENLVVFAALAITVHILQLSNSMTAAASALYFAARVTHLIVYTLGIPLLRTIAFATGFFCQMALALRIFGYL